MAGLLNKRLMLSSSFRCDQIYKYEIYNFGHTLLCYLSPTLMFNELTTGLIVKKLSLFCRNTYVSSGHSTGFIPFTQHRRCLLWQDSKYFTTPVCVVTSNYWVILFYVNCRYCFFSEGQLCTWNKPRSRERDSLDRKFSQIVQIRWLPKYWGCGILPRLLGLWNGRVYLWYGGSDLFALKPRVVPLLQKHFPNSKRKLIFRRRDLDDRLLQKPRGHS